MNADDLFPQTCGLLSPRLQWQQKHGVLTHFFDHKEAAPWMAIVPLDEDKGLDIAECMARNCRLYDEGDRIGYGLTEEDAMRDLATKLDLPTWNEDPA